MTGDQRARIVELRKAGKEYAEIGAAVGLATSTVGDALKRAGLSIPRKPPQGPDTRPLDVKYREFEEQMRACPIEIGLCVDQECAHGNIPSRRHPYHACGCWDNQV